MQSIEQYLLQTQREIQGRLLMNCCKRHGNQARNKYQRKRALHFQQQQQQQLLATFSGLATEVKKKHTRTTASALCSSDGKCWATSSLSLLLPLRRC